MKCRICGAEAKPRFTAEIRKKFEGNFFHCGNCGFLFAGDPVWLPEAYKESINISDTGLLQRNIHLSRITSALLYLFFNKEAKYLDYAGGYGLFTRLMRDAGYDFYWSDPYTQNIFAKGFEYNSSIKPLELVTAFEVFEHLPDPVTELDKLFAFSGNVAFSTELLPDPVPEPTNWWYYGFEHGQHISFYSEKTLNYLARKYNSRFYSAAGMHIFTRKQLSPVLLKAITLFIKADTFALLKKLLKSKTVDDHRMLKDFNS